MLKSFYQWNGKSYFIYFLHFTCNYCFTLENLYIFNMSSDTHNPNINIKNICLIKCYFMKY